MPFDLVASDKKGGAGGTCVLRGCVPKKLMVYGGEFAQAFKDSKGFGYAPLACTACNGPPSIAGQVCKDHCIAAESLQTLQSSVVSLCHAGLGY